MRASDRYRFEAPAPDPAPERPGIWPGSTDYASALGRLQDGELTLFELDSAVPREVPRVLLAPMLVQVLRSGGRALLIAPPSIDPEDAYLSIAEHVPADVLNQRLRVLAAMTPKSAPADLPDVFVPVHRIRWTGSGSVVPVPEDPAFLHQAQESERPNLIVAYLSGLQALADTAGVSFSAGVLAGLNAAIFPRGMAHVVAVGRSGDPHMDVLLPVMETHLRLRAPHGRTFLNGDRPYLAPMVLSQELGTEPYRLTPVM
jgi:hypothetical protein